MNDNFILEAYPNKILARLEQRDREKRKNTPSYINGHIRELVFEDLKLWRVGTITVSFKGGNSKLHEKISSIANIWTKHGNINFDFGFNEHTGRYRTWHENDNSHIRVGFQHQGYWSLIGTDSTDEQIVKPADISLNLSNFDYQLPNNWEGTVLHEFGHALGFHHSHQSPHANCDFNWEKVYKELGQPPNEWSRERVNHNLRQLHFEGLTFSAHDKSSIMHYSLPSWMFFSKEQSQCYTTRNNSLSEEDKRMMKTAYPYEHGKINLIDIDRLAKLESLLDIPNLSESLKTQHLKHLEYYRDFIKNNIYENE